MEVSLYIECWHEASKHRWIESQKRGVDLGEAAIHEWFGRYWAIFCRISRLEHLAGIRLWAEFPRDDYGLLETLQAQEDHETIEWILERAWQGLENLNLIEGARDGLLPMDRVIHILSQLHLNLAQLAPPVAAESKPFPKQYATPGTLQQERR